MVKTLNKNTFVFNGVILCYFIGTCNSRYPAVTLHDSYCRLHDKSLKITLSLNSRLTAVDCIKSGSTKYQVNVKLKLQVNGRRLHEASLTSLRLSLLTDGLHKTSFG